MVEKAKWIGRLGMYRHKIVASVCREMHFFHPVAAPLAMLPPAHGCDSLFAFIRIPKLIKHRR